MKHAAKTNNGLSIIHQRISRYYITTMDEETSITLKNVKGEVCSVKADLVKLKKMLSGNKRDIAKLKEERKRPQPTWDDVNKLERENKRLRRKVDSLEEKMNPQDFWMRKLLKDENNLPTDLKDAILQCLPGRSRPTAGGIQVPVLIEWEDKNNPEAVLLYNVKNCAIMPVLVRNAAAKLLSEKHENYSPPSIYDGGGGSSSSSSSYGDSTVELVYANALKDSDLHKY